MEPWQSWTVVLLGGGAAWWYYKSQNKSRAKNTRTPSIPASGQTKAQKRRDDGKSRRKKDEALQGSDHGSSDRPIDSLETGQASVGGTDLPKKRKGGKHASGKAAVSSAVEPLAAPQGSNQDDDGAEEGLDNREFARQLSGLKTGTSLAPSVRQGPSKRAAKQARTNGFPQQSLQPLVPDNNAGLNSQSVSATSSTTGADADDDLSPALSPSLRATSTGRTSTSGDVSDMLESPAAGPSVLRLIDSKDSQQTKKPQQPKVPQAQETKKQRQNRQKAEEKKIAREQQEKERRVLLERQLRTAREAEGRPARNGTSSSKPPVTNAWAAHSIPVQGHLGVSTQHNTKNDTPLLDTFEHGELDGRDDVAVSHPQDFPSQAWERDLPSEEDQLKMLNEMTDHGWNTVSKGRKAKKKPVGINGDATGNDSSDGGLAKVQKADNGTFNAPATSSDQVKPIEESVVKEPANATNPAKGNPHDSDWAVV